MTAGAPALTALLDELDRLRAAATPGPWTHDGQEIHRSQGTGPFAEVADLDNWVVEICQPVDIRLTEANAALITAAVNAVPRLTAAVRAALAVADELSRVDEQFEVGDLRSTLADALDATP